jgi:hypothetical protein
MKKLLFLPFLLLSINLSSQEKWETTYKAGINFSFLSHHVSTPGNKIFIGATGGLEQTYNFDYSIFSLQSGLEYEFIGEGISTVGVTVGNSNPTNSTLSRSNFNYLSVPLHLRCMINQHLGALAGAAYRFGLGGTQGSINLSNNDVSLDAGLFYMLNKMRFNLIYQHGLSDINPGYQMIQSRNRTITFTVSVPLWKE